VSLESPGLENIPQVLGNRNKVGQNHAARKALWATFSVLNEEGLFWGQKLERERSIIFPLSILPKTKAITS